MRSGAAVLTVAAPGLVSITVTPIDAAFPCQGTLQFQADGLYENGATESITTRATWSSSDIRVATFDNSRKPRGLATRVLSDGTSGEITITASLDLIRGTTKAGAPACVE